MKELAKGKVISIEDRLPKMKERRRKKANRRLAFLLTLFALLIGSIVYVQSPLSRVSEIQISGSTVYSDEKIKKLSGITSKTHIWKVEKDKIEKELKKLPEIKEADVKIKLPATVSIQISEWKSIGIVRNDNGLFPVLENGDILEKREEAFSHHAPLLVGFSEGEILDEMIAELMELPEEVHNSISEIHYAPKKTDQYHIFLYMNDGFQVSASIRSFNEKMVHYPAIVSQLDPNVKGIIDLEVGTFFKAYESEGAENGSELEEQEEG